MEDRKKYHITLIEILVVTAIGALILSIFWPAGHEPAPNYYCRSNLRLLFIAFMNYRTDNSTYPEQKVWCDAIQPYFTENKERYRCLNDNVGPCSYAMNENVPADVNELLGDLVLLFESAPGWNNVGGVDDVVTDRHGRPGANIAFTDGHVEFVEADKIPKLRWTIDNADSVPSRE